MRIESAHAAITTAYNSLLTDVEGLALYIDGGDPVNNLAGVAIQTTDGETFDAIGMNKGDMPHTFAVCLGGYAIAKQDGSITSQGRQLLGASTTGALKSVESGGREVSVLGFTSDTVTFYF